MEALTKKLAQLSELLKAIKKPAEPTGPKLPSIPAIKPPSPPSITPSASAAPKISMGSGPNSKKDPKKVAQQIKDGSMSTKTQKVMLKTQWSDEDVEKADQDAGKLMYHIHKDGHRITSEPLNLQQIDKRHGGVKKLEASGFRLMQHKPQALKADHDTWAANPQTPATSKLSV